MEGHKDDQPLSELVKAYINERRNGKVVKLLKDKPDKNGKGGISQKLISKIENMSKGNIELGNRLKEIRKTKKSKDETDLAFHLKQYGNFLSLAHTCSSVDDIEDIVSEYTKKLK